MLFLKQDCRYNVPSAMGDTFTCPRCFFTAPLARDLRFCPRCGLKDPIEAAQDTAPLEFRAGGREFRAEDRIAIGSVCSIYRCRFQSDGRAIEGVLKIAREACSNHLVGNEAQVLRFLHESDSGKRFGAFLPSVEHSFALGSNAPRQGNVLRMHEEIKSPDELYTLEEVRAAYPAGLDGRDVAWIWRRLLGVLGFAHSHGVVHGAVLPMHVMIEPREHKLVLIDWCFAVHSGLPPRAVEIMGGYVSWYKRDGSFGRVPAPPLDVSFGVRCMIELLGGDCLEARMPPNVEAGLGRHFERCLSGNADAWKMLNDFDRLIEAMWGPRKFRELPMPPKSRV